MSYLPLFQILFQLPVQRETLQLRLGEDRPDVHDLVQGQVQGVQGGGPVLLEERGEQGSNVKWIKLREIENAFTILWAKKLELEYPRIQKSEK